MCSHTNLVNDYLVCQQVTFATNAKSRLLGLMGKTDFEGLLVLTPCKDIHTFGMKMNIDVAFVGVGGRVLRSVWGLEPHNRLRCKGAIAVLERQSSDEPWLLEGDVVRLACANSP